MAIDNPPLDRQDTEALLTALLADLHTLKTTFAEHTRFGSRTHHEAATDEWDSGYFRGAHLEAIQCFRLLTNLLERHEWRTQ